MEVQGSEYFRSRTATDLTFTHIHGVTPDARAALVEVAQEQTKREVERTKQIALETKAATHQHFLTGAILALVVVTGLIVSAVNSSIAPWAAGIIGAGFIYKYVADKPKKKPTEDGSESPQLPGK